MLMLRPIILVSGVLGVALAGEPVLTREGKYWVEVRSASEPVASSARVRIASRGPVTLNGNPGSGLSYSLKIRVKAANAREARQMVERFTATTAPKAATGSMNKRPHADPGAPAAGGWRIARA